MEKQKAHISIDNGKCGPCPGLICVGVCPEGILEQGPGRKPKVVAEASCTLCEVCASLCPTRAIIVKRG